MRTEQGLSVAKSPAETPGRSRKKYPYKLPGKSAKKAKFATVPVQLQMSKPQNAKKLISFYEKLGEKPKIDLKIESKKVVHISTSKQPKPKATVQAKISSYFMKPSPPTFNSSYPGPRIKKGESDPKLTTENGGKRPG